MGLDGVDQLSSAFNRTALIGGRGNDKLKTEVLVDVPPADPVQGLAIQYGGKGDDTLDAKLTLRGGDPSAFDQDLNALNLLSGGSGNDTIKAVANVVAPVFGNVTLANRVFGGAGDDTIDVLADARGALNGNVVKNYVDGGSGKDHIKAWAETELIGSVATAMNVLKGGAGDDVLDASASGRAQGTDLVKNYSRPCRAFYGWHAGLAG